MIRLDKSQPHVRYYFWCLDVWEEFTGAYVSRNRSNRCMYIWAMVAPVVVLVAHIGFSAFALYVLVYYPVTRFGVLTYAGMIGAVAATVVAFMLFNRWRRARKMRERIRRYEQGVADSEESVTECEAEKGPNLITIAWGHLVELKKKVCPIIEFTGSTSQQTEAS